jgi:hypothetical protein
VYILIKNYLGGFFCLGVVPDGTYEFPEQATTGSFTFSMTFAMDVTYNSVLF